MIHDTGFEFKNLGKNSIHQLITCHNVARKKNKNHLNLADVTQLTVTEVALCCHLMLSRGQKKVTMPLTFMPDHIGCFFDFFFSTAFAFIAIFLVVRY